ncbi:MAG: AAA family ATPase [bacterium]
MSVVYKLKGVLKKRGISYRALAEGLPVSAATLSDILNHQRWPETVDALEIKEKIGMLLDLAGAPGNGDLWELEKSLTPAASVPLRKGQKKYKDVETKILRRPTMLTGKILEKLELSKDPFFEEMDDYGDILLTQQHEFVLEKMKDAAQKQRMIGVFDDEVGGGKTIVKKLFLEWLSRQNNPPFLVSEPQIVEKAKCVPGAIIDSMIQDFFYKANVLQKAPGRTMNTMVLERKSRIVCEQLKWQWGTGKRSILIIDEAHLLPDATLKSLKNFHEMTNGLKKILAIVIIGQRELFMKLNEPGHEIREVAARIDLVKLDPIPNLVQRYIEFKIDRAGGDYRKIFDESAIAEITRMLPNANPLMINNLAAGAIEEAYRLGRWPVTAETLENLNRKL